MIDSSEQYSKSKLSTSGFTIIEVVIVLAIAGLIMLIVFIAVPGLQRASRNNARQGDIARLYTAINTYLSEHPELTISAGPNQILRSTGKIVGYQGEAGNLEIINNKCPLDTGSTLSISADPVIGDAIHQRDAACNDGTDDGQGVFTFRENNPSHFHGELGPYLPNGSVYGPDTVHIMYGAQCDPIQAGDHTELNYTHFHEQGDIHYIAIAYALETAGDPIAFCRDLTT